ncbi:MAG: sulfatase-like hydrolase/transferase [Kiritimatiellia bacterium]|jgi:choline-sulfatase|nr:sulfatase-like hydrolase/transferase [Kiritimatiellia bacterium]MDD4173746.1 sulfatase-like hydrolase/transferase [Kiritimatiellia bacterium]MDD4441253.1 sulfatase-like hydrolase/transferase [Kiritimatiellia bacterium]MDX9793773.1 sulfatase-like hydrolase/transferase [Kiritimatiellia bacterium]
MNRRAFLSALACAGAVRFAGHAAAPSGRPPNILLLYTDDQTFDSIRALGNSEIRTPNLDRLAAAGTVFTNCYNQGAWHGAVCVASRTMLNTGRFLWEACAIEKQLKDEADRQRLWPQLMRQAGYRTCMTGKWHVSGITPAQVFDDARHVRGGMPATCEEAYERPRADGSDPWQPWDTARGGHWAGGKHWSEVTADDAISFLQAPQQPHDSRPFFIYAAFNAPHDPRQSPREMVQAYPPGQLALPPNFMPAHPHKDAIGCAHTLRDERLAPDPRTPHAVRVHRAEYYALITWLDAQIGRVLDALDAAGRANDTVIFFTSDNGLAVGQHGFMGKQNMFEHSMKVPLIAAGPGFAAGRRIAAPVYLQDIMPTSLELAGAARPAHVRFRSLLPLARDSRAPHYDAIYGGYMTLQRMVRVGDMKLIWYPQPKVFMLFDLARDPHECHDLAGDPAHRATRAALTRRLAALQRELSDPLPPVPVGNGEEGAAHDA